MDTVMRHGPPWYSLLSCFIEIRRLRVLIGIQSLSLLGSSFSIKLSKFFESKKPMAE